MTVHHSDRMPPKAPQVRFSVEPADVPPEKAARRMHLTLAQFEAVKDRLFLRGFPRPDIDTGMYDLEAIDAWRRRRHAALYDLTRELKPEQAPETRSLGDRLREAKEHRRHG